MTKSNPLLSSLGQSTAEHLAALPLRGLECEYPNHLSHTLNGPQDARTPRELHPVFYGCWDWHSAVHGYWLLARCAQGWPEIAQRARIEDVFERHFQPAPMRAELAYFEAPTRSSFERPYGWAWAFALGQALAEWEHPRAGAWSAALAPLLTLLRTRMLAHLQALSYPIRAGTHANTAFALLLMLRFAREGHDTEFAQALSHAAQRFYGQDRNYPWAYEPGGGDFLSPGLCEAQLMAEVLDAPRFSAWWDGFAGPDGLQLSPAEVSDRSDPHICHLDGLNLSRAWCLRVLARQLPQASADALIASADTHLQASLPHVASGHYEGEHWLATFAMLALEG